MATRSTELFDQILDKLQGVPDEVVGTLSQTITKNTIRKKWTPNAGPQTEAYLSQADVLLYGGQAAGGKTDLLAGLALTKHLRTLLMRRQYTDLGAMIERAREIDGTYLGFNGAPPPRLRTADGRLIDFGAAAKVGDERHWQGQPHDFLGLDEVVHFLESQVRFLMGWVRTAVEGQRCRVVFATNPPDTADGDFIIGMFRPWLDLTHHNPAKPGELRWYVTDPDGKDFEVADSTPYQFPGAEKLVQPQSRTFIPASLRDNPYLRDTGYAATLDSLPEPLRSAVRDGNFMASRTDDAWQLIPTGWIREAQARWVKGPPPGVPMTTMAIDPASGGEDRSVIAMRHDGWFAPLLTKPGRETPMGTEIAGLVIMHRTDLADVVVDMGGGYGGVPFTTLSGNGIEPIGHKGSERSMARTADRKLGFYNKRSEIWWKLREALDPAQRGGSGVALPDDQELLSELTSVRFSMVTNSGVMSVKAETKEDVVKRLGHSPDLADAVTMCWSIGGATVLGQIMPRDQRVGGNSGRLPKAITSKSKRSKGPR